MRMCKKCGEVMTGRVTGFGGLAVDAVKPEPRTGPWNQRVMKSRLEQNIRKKLFPLSPNGLAIKTDGRSETR